MPSAEIITIGTEILLGEIIDTNAQYIARNLRDAGIDVYRKTSVGDNVQRIAQAIQQAMERCDIIITSGGLGPTVDDPTREGVAAALGVGTEFRPELWEQIQSRFERYGRKPTENNRRQAYIPIGSTAMENPVGTAPCFIVEKENLSIISLPGVPREMEYLLKNTVLPYLRKRYSLTGIIKARVLHTAGVGESLIDEKIGDLEMLANPTVGLAAHAGQVDIRITAKANSLQQADEMIRPVEDDLRQRMGRWIYGVDDETLEQAALRAIQEKGWSLAVLEAGLGGELSRSLSGVPGPFRGGEIISLPPSRDEFRDMVASYRQLRQADMCLGVAIYRGAEKQDVFIILITPEQTEEFTRPYGGAPESAPRWALNHCLDLLRRL